MLEAYPDPLRRHGVDHATFVRYVRVLAAAADHASGRGIQLANAQIGRRVGCCVEHVRRCRRVAEDLGLYALIMPGRHMTRQERDRARRGGSRHRGLANESALVVPHWILPRLFGLADQDRSDPHTYRDVDDARPPSGSPVGTTVTVSDGVLAPAGARAAAPPSPRSTSPRPTGSKPARDAGFGLAVELVESVGWLRGCPPGRISQGLRRFAAAGWSGRDVITAMDALHARRGWDAPTRSRLREPPWGLLAWYLRQLDPSDPPRPALRHEPVRGCGGFVVRWAPGALRAAVAQATSVPDRAHRRALSAAVRAAIRPTRAGG